MFHCVVAFLISCTHDFYDEDIPCLGLYDTCGCTELFNDYDKNWTDDFIYDDESDDEDEAVLTA